MQRLEKAMIVAMWHDLMDFIAVQFNPTEFTLNKTNQIAEVPIPGLDTPLLQFVRGQSEVLTVDLFFDTTENGTGAGAVSVTTETDKIYQLMKIDPHTHAPPVCAFLWNDKFPGNDVSESVGNQKRNDFQCVVESVRQKFTLFSPEGIPLRATLTVTLREYKTLDEQLKQLNLNSPDKTQGYILRSDDTLAGLAARQYLRPGEWRAIADANDIEDPRRLVPGSFVRIPPIT